VGAQKVRRLTFKRRKRLWLSREKVTESHSIVFDKHKQLKKGNRKMVNK
jgi:hypothetical protein